MGVRVNIFVLGIVLASGGTWQRKWQRKLNEDRDAVETYINEEVSLKRLGTPEEIADTVIFLASQRTRFVTGTLWVVDGGQTHV